jgi:ABC-type lipoprotein export system ATPase subunit
MTKQVKIVIVVTHNRKMLSHCTKIISLDEQG